MAKKKELSAERIVILDFRKGKVYIRFVPMSMVEKDADEIVYYFAPKLNLHHNDCQYMVVNSMDYLDDNTLLNNFSK